MPPPIDSAAAGKWLSRPQGQTRELRIERTGPGYRAEPGSVITNVIPSAAE